MEASRILALDIARGLAVFGMVIVHTLWMYADKETQFNSMLGTVVHFLGQEAVAFLMSMGISLALSSRQLVSTTIKRGALLVIAGYVLNILKFIVPIAVFGTMPEAFINAYGWQSPLNASQYLYLILTGDILQMAGISLFVIAALRYFEVGKWWIFAVALVVIGLSSELRGLQPGIKGLNYVADLFFAENYNVYFPVFPWMGMILTGFALGKWFKELDSNLLSLFKVTWIPSVILLLLSSFAVYQNSSYHFNDYFHLGPAGTLLIMAGNWLFFMFLYYIADSMNHHLRYFLVYCSQNVTTIYVIQWTAICWIMGIVGFQTLNTYETMAMMVVNVIVTFSLQALLDKFVLSKARLKKKSSATQVTRKATAVSHS
ncbi:MAG: DUF1624 domain-containing protein [Pseudobacteriovorax sp.]|nr:DUF1624 domain-containing protein [Pseudobacteriovorax sp.]